MPFDYHYTHLCAPSTETRGRRPAHDTGCGLMCVRSTHTPIEGENRTQGSPCPNCGKRTRLNEGLVDFWFCREDAVNHATEYNEANRHAIRHSAGEENAEQNGEENDE